MRAGCKMHNGKEIPDKAKVFKSKSGKDCYVSGLRNDNGVWIASVMYIDEQKISDVNYDNIKKYIS